MCEWGFVVGVRRRRDAPDGAVVLVPRVRVPRERFALGLAHALLPLFLAQRRHVAVLGAARLKRLHHRLGRGARRGARRAHLDVHAGMGLGRGVGRHGGREGCWGGPGVSLIEAGRGSSTLAAARVARACCHAEWQRSLAEGLAGQGSSSAFVAAAARSCSSTSLLAQVASRTQAALDGTTLCEGRAEGMRAAGALDVQGMAASRGITVPEMSTPPKGDERPAAAGSARPSRSSSTCLRPLLRVVKAAHGRRAFLVTAPAVTASDHTIYSTVFDFSVAKLLSRHSARLAARVVSVDSGHETGHARPPPAAL